jgi:hypothetical protein
VVKAHAKAMERAVAQARDLPAFTAATERLKRSLMGGGSVSSALFHGEELTDVVVTGACAVGRRRRLRGSDESVTFVQHPMGVEEIANADRRLGAPPPRRRAECREVASGGGRPSLLGR